MNKTSKFKVVVLGDSGSGKTCLIKSFLRQPFQTKTDSTESFEVSLFEFTRNDQKYEVQLWDCGRNFFDINEHIRKAFFNHASAVFITYDLKNKAPIDRLAIWLQQAQANECYLVYIFATKSDEEKNPDLADFYEFTEQYNIPFFKYSAKDPKQENIARLFIKIDNDKSFISRESLVKGSRFSHIRGSMHSDGGRNSISNINSLLE